MEPEFDNITYEDLCGLLGQKDVLIYRQNREIMGLRQQEAQLRRIIEDQRVALANAAAHPHPTD